MTETNVQIAEGWIREHSRANLQLPDAERALTYWNKLTDLVCDMPFDAWPIILEIVDRSIDATVIENLSAGPLEDLLTFHGHEIIDLVEEEAAKNERLRIVLGGVWENNIPEGVWQRIRGLRSRQW